MSNAVPLALLIIGVIVAIAAIRNTHGQLGTLIAGDFTGAGNFIYWIAAVVIIGGLGYLPGFAGPSRALLALIMLSLFLSNGGVFNKLTDALANPAPAAAVPKEALAPGPLTVNVSGVGSAASSAAGGIIGTVVKAATGT